jgi:hypothetical protein
MAAINVRTKLTKGQAEFLRRADDPLVILSTSIAYGKSYAAALWIIMELVQGKKILAGAQSHGALRKVLFTHVKNLLYKFKIPFKQNKEDRSISVMGGSVYGFSNESPDDVLGMTDAEGFVLDEAARCSELFYQNLASRCRGEGITVPKHRLISSPLEEPSARWFLELKQKNPECVIHGSMYENIFLSKEFIKSQEDIYVIGSPLYRRQVLGEDIEGDFLNALVKVEDFASRSECVFNPFNGPVYFGLDLAGMGRDLNVATLINEGGMIGQKAVSSLDTNGQVALVKEAFEERNVSCGALDYTGGYGNGVYDGVKHDSRINMMPVTFGEAPIKDIYLNVRSEMYMELAEEIRHGFYIDVEANPELVEELRNTQVFIDEKGKLRIIPKEMIKRTIGRSPDRADSLALAVYAKNHGKKSSAINVARKILALNS